MKITEYSAAETLPVDFLAKRFCITKEIEIIHLTLKPGEVLERHKNPMDVIFYVISGKAIFEAETSRYVVNSNTLLEVESSVERGWINTGNENLNLLVIKLNN